jgi:hypothetical protein
MADLYPRSITFSIPGELGLPGLQVTVVENAGNLDFTVEGITAESRGLFFQLIDESVLRTLKILGGDGLITKTQIKANGVIASDLNNTFTFDVGVAFKATTGPVHFTLDATRALTLDDIANAQFGTATVGNQLTSGRFVAPAAPDAKNDTITTREDTAITIPVLANDTDADFQQLTVTSVHLESGTHGTVSIASNGQSIIYTPDKDYAGPNFNLSSIDATFKYTVSDGFGGQDTASVNVHIVPIADQPTITVEVLTPEASDPINMVRLKVTATQTDLDRSEFIDRIEFATLPTGFQLITDGNLSTTGQPDSATEFVQVLLPTGLDVNFDLNVTAYAKEEGNGSPDEASASAVQHMGIDFNHNQGTETFETNNQSIWNTGAAFSIDQNFFFGGDQPFAIDGLVDGHVKAGFTADLNLHGGDIDAKLPVDVTVDTTYNKTTDSLLIHTSAVLAATGANFTTTGPEGNLGLGFLIDVAIDAGIIGSGSINETSGIPLFPNPFGTNTSFTSQGLWGSVNVAWPHLAVTNDSQTGNTITGDGTSNDFITIVADIDGIATLLLFPIGPIHDALTAIGPDYQDPNPDSTFQLLDFDITGTAKLLEEFVLKLLDVNGTLIFEDGKTQQFKLGDDIVIRDAKTHDLDGNGTIDFKVVLTPHVTLDNNLSAKIGVDGDLWLIKNAGDVAEGIADFLGIDLPLHWDVFAADTDIPIVDGAPFNLVGFNNQSFEFLV